MVLYVYDRIRKLPLCQRQYMNIYWCYWKQNAFWPSAPYCDSNPSPAEDIDYGLDSLPPHLRRRRCTKGSRCPYPWPPSRPWRPSSSAPPSCTVPCELCSSPTSDIPCCNTSLSNNGCTWEKHYWKWKYQINTKSSCQRISKLSDRARPMDFVWRSEGKAIEKTINYYINH